MAMVNINSSVSTYCFDLDQRKWQDATLPAYLNGERLRIFAVQFCHLFIQTVRIRRHLCMYTYDCITASVGESVDVLLDSWTHSDETGRTLAARRYIKSLLHCRH